MCDGSSGLRSEDYMLVLSHMYFRHILWGIRNKDVPEPVLMMTFCQGSDGEAIDCVGRHALPARPVRSSPPPYLATQPRTQQMNTNRGWNSRDNVHSCILSIVFHICNNLSQSAWKMWTYLRRLRRLLPHKSHQAVKLGSALSFSPHGGCNTFSRACLHRLSPAQPNQSYPSDTNGQYCQDTLEGKASHYFIHSLLDHRSPHARRLGLSSVVNQPVPISYTHTHTHTPE